MGIRNVKYLPNRLKVVFCMQCQLMLNSSPNYIPPSVNMRSYAHHSIALESQRPEELHMVSN